jgi:phosphoglycerate dehydrogenase-like enzyme
VIRILVDVPVEDASIAALREISGLEVRVIPFSESTRELPHDVIADADILFCTYPPSNFDEMKCVRWIQIASSGYTQLLPLDLPSKQIRATNARGCFDVPISEWNIAMMVNLLRDVPQMLRNQDAHIWDRSVRFTQEVRGMTLGLWGYGGLGRETARLAKLMGMRVHVLARRGVHPAPNLYRVSGTGDPEGTLPDRVFSAKDAQQFLSELDFLILAMPLTPLTEGLIGEKELQALPRSAFVLNPARGPLIQEQALLRALREGWIAGAALDTHYQYPLPPDHPLWSLPNVILTPHISGTSLPPIFRTRVWDLFLKNVRLFLQGDVLLNELTDEQLRGR